MYYTKYVCTTTTYWVLICTVLMFHVCITVINCYQLSTVIFYAGDKQENQCYDI